MLEYKFAKVSKKKVYDNNRYHCIQSQFVCIIQYKATTQTFTCPHYDLLISLDSHFIAYHVVNKLSQVILTSNNKPIVVVNSKLTDSISHGGFSKWLSNAQRWPNWLMYLSETEQELVSY